ncbi:MAG TPA: class I SAM-dependent methyltransferase [Chlorobiota bacterium]|nr:class I SAM-dependent methyltransferase [Chlorobiota bacterium]
MTQYDLLLPYLEQIRSEVIGVPDVLDIAQRYPSTAMVLDIGCGTGIPITRALTERFQNVYAVDSSVEMVKRFRENLPDVPVTCTSIDGFDFFGTTFDVIVAWGIIFHLPFDVQERVLPAIVQHMRPGGRCIFTSARMRNHHVSDAMNGVEVPYYSLGYGEYSKLFIAHGAIVERMYDDVYGNTHYVVTRG